MIEQALLGQQVFKLHLLQVIERAQPHIGRADWQKVMSGVSRRDSLLLASLTLAHMYKQQLPTSFIS